jgi:hypothetical protein
MDGLLYKSELGHDSARLRHGRHDGPEYLLRVGLLQQGPSVVKRFKFKERLTARFRVKFASTF